MSEIKDRVYLNGEWIDDYYLTSEKNQELKDLRTDLTNESQIREENDNKLSSVIKANDSASKTRLNAAVTEIKNTLEQNIKEVNESIKGVDNKVTEEVSRATNKDSELEKSISDEKTRAEGKEAELASQIQTLELGGTNTYETKEDAEEKRSTLDKKIDDTKSELESKITDDIAKAIDDIVNADEDGIINKLEEIADWINNDQTGATKIVSDIADLKARDTELEKKITDDVKTEADAREAKDTELENKFNNYYTKTESDSTFVKTEGYIAYSQEEKDKLAKFEDSDNYEKIMIQLIQQQKR